MELDVDRFSTNFNPYDVGIIAAIAQTLLPGVASKYHGKTMYSENLGVVAESYKLNVVI